MAFIDDVLDSLAVNVGAALAPFQPNIPPNYPNGAPTAGYIPPTLIAAGHPIQVKVLTRLENHQAQVSVYAGKTERVMPYYDSLSVISTPGGDTTQTGRSEKQVLIEVWSYDRPSRAKITNVIRGYMGDFFRQPEVDTTVTSLMYNSVQEFDDEQSDSVYVSQLYYVADFDTLQVPIGPATYPVSEVDLSMTMDTHLLGVIERIRT